MSFLKNFLFALALCVLTLSAKALVLTADSKQVNLSGSAQFLEDPTGQ
jgi:hypothetical protein